MRLLVVNPNTTAAMTAAVGRAARGVAAPGTVVEAVNPALGPASIEGFYDEALAVPGMLAEIRAGEARGADAAIIACFDDTGLDAARSLASIPVVGLCEAALALAGMVAARISIVTSMPAAIVPLEGLVHRYGFGARARVHASGIPVLALEEPEARPRLEAAIREALRADRGEAVVLGCAGMAELARDLTATFGLPVIDGVSAAVKQAEALVALGLRTSKTGAYAPPRL